MSGDVVIIDLFVYINVLLAEFIHIIIEFTFEINFILLLRHNTNWQVLAHNVINNDIGKLLWVVHVHVVVGMANEVVLAAIVLVGLYDNFTIV